jgi:hypothetical protein
MKKKFPVVASVPIGTLLYRNEAVWEVVEYVKIKHKQLFLRETNCAILVCTACQLYSEHKKIDIVDADDLVFYKKWTPALNRQLKAIDWAYKNYRIKQDRLNKMLINEKKS